MKKTYIQPAIKVKAVACGEDLLQASGNGITIMGLDGVDYGGKASEHGVTSADAKSHSLWQSWDDEDE